MHITPVLTETASRIPTLVAPVASQTTRLADWRDHLPSLRAGAATLRQLHASDAPSLHAALTTDEVTRFISPPPSTVEGFRRFIAWTMNEQAHGRYVCFGIVPDGCEHAVGIIQVRQLDPGFATAEWGFALGSAFWGTGLFHASAQAVIEFAFEQVGVHRLEARAAVANGRGNAALRKLGAMPEGVLRKSFLRNGQYLDQVLWGIVSSDWIHGTPIELPRLH
jgi:RimJ/RimL family protein N-acetyltransferase